MSIELLTNEHMLSFKNALKNVEKEIKIISPFIGLNTSSIISDYLKQNKNCKCTIITRFYRQDFLDGVSNLDALKLLINSNVDIYALKNLHSKLYLIDGNYGIIGSANFTMGGFKSNHELSLEIEDEVELLEDLSIYFDDLKNRIIDNGEYKLTPEKIEDESIMVNKIFKGRKDKTVKYRNSITWGADITKIVKEEIIEKDNIEEFLRNEVISSNDIAWLKFEGTGDNRFENTYKYLPNKLSSKNIYAASFPKKPRSIEGGVTLFISVLSYDNKGNAIPMIVGRTKSKGYNSNNIVTDFDIKKTEWLERYPYYVELYNIEIINSEIVNGISLNEMIMQLKTDLYPNTVGKNIGQEDIRKRHHQKSHIRITSLAKDILNEKLDDLFNKYGSINL